MTEVEIHPTSQILRLSASGLKQYKLPKNSGDYNKVPQRPGIYIFRLKKSSFTVHLWASELHTG